MKIENLEFNSNLKHMKKVDKENYVKNKMEE